MDEARIARGALFRLLLESAARLAALARLTRPGTMASLLTTLSSERSQLASLVLRQYLDPVALEDDFGGNWMDAAAEEAEGARGQEEYIAAEVALAGEGEIADFMQDLPDGVLTEDVRDAIGRAVSDGMNRLRRHRDATRQANRSINFSTKSAQPGGAAPAPHIPVYKVWFGTNRKSILRDSKVIGFSGENGGHTIYGMCSVTIPTTHQLTESKPSLLRRLVLAIGRWA